MLRKQRKEKAPLLYDLTTLQRDANRYYGLTAKQTLDLAQKLYEEKLITYPRTDSQYLPEDAEATARRVITLIHEKYHPLGPFDEPKQPFLKQVIDSSKVTDHHAILPTEELRNYDLHSLKETEYQVLFLIAIRLLMATDQEYKYEEISVQVESKGELFEAKGKKILQYGWKLYEECFKNDQGMAMEEFCASEKEFPEVIKRQSFGGFLFKRQCIIRHHQKNIPKIRYLLQWKQREIRTLKRKPKERSWNTGNKSVHH